MAAWLFVGLFVALQGNPGQDPLSAAKDLYASAAYEEALSTLSLLTKDGVNAPALARQVDEYRSFCLFALGRTAEAEAVAEELIRRDPLASLSADDASPRLEAMFASVRKRLLPGLIRERYRAVRGLLDDKQFAAAEPRLADVRLLLTEAERLGAWDEGLGDLSVLVDGFLALSRANAAAAPRASAPVPPPAPPAASASTPVPANLGAAPDGPRTYGIEDVDVTPPVPTNQRTPAVPTDLLPILKNLRRPMILLVTVDETGRVLRADIRAPSNTTYDELLIREASTWRYRPAMRGGVPVRYERAVVVNVK